MSHFIERGRETLRTLEDIKVANKEIYSTAIDLLRAHGVPHREGLIFKYQVLNHTVNSTEPSVGISLVAGANLDKARSVFIRVEGQRPIRVYKRGRRGHERFEGVEVMSSGDEYALTSVPSVGIDYSRGYRDVLNLLRAEIASSK